MSVAIDAQGIQDLFPEIAEIQDSRLKQGVIDIWLEVAAEIAWSDFNEIPKNLGGEKHRSLVGHIRGVTKMALAMADIAVDPHFQERGMIQKFEDDTFGVLAVPGVAPQLSVTPGGISWLGPQEVGSHNREIYGDLLGISDDELVELADDGII